MGYELKDFVVEVDRILDDVGPTVEAIWEMRPRLQKLVAEGGDLTKQGEASVGSTGLPSRILHVDPQGRYKFVLASFPPGEPTPIHSHYRWGLECGVAGKERFTVWRRVSDDESGQASLQVVTDHHVERGDLGYWYDSPRNIHRQWAEGDGPSSLAIVLGGDGGRQHVFDLESGEYSSA